MGFSRIQFKPTESKKLTCPRCGHALTHERTCLEVMLSCHACGGRFDPARFVADLDDDFEEAYANVPLSRM